jgi:hypothetical protein
VDKRIAEKRVQDEGLVPAAAPKRTDSVSETDYYALDLEPLEDIRWESFLSNFDLCLIRPALGVGALWKRSAQSATAAPNLDLPTVPTLSNSRHSKSLRVPNL